MTPLEELKAANDAYHLAANQIFRLKISDVTDMTKQQLTDAKAKFGSYHHNIFKLMKEAQAALAPLFEGDD